MPKLRTKAQNSLMHGLAARCGLTHSDLQDWASEISSGRTTHTSELYYTEALEIINRLEKLVKPQTDWSPRTVQYRRQATGVKQIVTPEQLKLMRDLWFSVDGRTQNGLDSLCVRINKIEKPRTTKECSNVIEAIKSMNKRAETFNAFKKQEAA